MRIIKSKKIPRESKTHFEKQLFGKYAKRGLEMQGG